MMGIRLIVEVLDHAPDDLTPAELVLLLVLAEYARDDTRECWPGLDVLTRRSRLKQRAVREALVRLAGRGVDVRVPLTKDKNGRVVYAARGRRVIYRIPGLKGGTTSPPLAEERRRPEVRKAAPQRLKGGTTSPPFPSSPQEPSSLSLRARQSPLANLGATEDEIKIIEEKVRTEHRPRNLGAYIAGMAPDDLADLLADVREEQQRIALAAAIAIAKIGPECVDGVPGGDDPEHPQCPLCRRRRKGAA